jgi:hypothetical protein
MENTIISLLDISDIDCNNLNIAELQKILSSDQIKNVNDTCSKPIVNKTESESAVILQQMNNLLKSEQPSIPTPPIPTVTPPTVTPQAIPVTKSLPIVDIIEPPQLLTTRNVQKINMLKPQSAGLKDFVSSHVLLGGSNLIGLKISIDKITKLLNVSDEQSQIMTWYYNNETQLVNNESLPKILNMDELILVSAVLKYYDFIEKKYESIFDVIQPESINNIPYEYRYNFSDIVIRDKNLNPEIITKFNDKVNTIKNMMYNLKMRNQDTLTFEPLDKYIINVTKSAQTGGNKQNEKIVEEEINDKIRRLSDYLKKQKKNKQSGGDPTSDKIDEIKKEIDMYNALTPQEKNVKRQKIVQYSNQAVNILLTLNVATKKIEDNEFGIAIFQLEKTQNIPNLDEVLKFVNDNASVLNFKNRNTNTIFAETLTVTKMGNAKPLYYTDKLEKYFKNRYEKLKNKQLEPSKLEIVSVNEPVVLYNSNNYTYNPSKEQAIKLVDLFKILLNVQSGGGQVDYVILNKPDSSELIESYFTSRQYTKFLRIMTDYLKSQNQDLDKPEFDKMKKDIETLQEIEKRLVDLYTIFKNYKKIQEQFPQNIQKPVTVDHIKKVLTDNNILIDKYGNVNTKIIDLVKSIEKNLLYVEATAEIKENPNLKMELDNLMSTQKGGANLQQVKKFTPFKEDEYFTTDTFKKILKEMNE